MSYNRLMDIVYFTREGENEELKYSLRSLSNLKYDRVVFYGGCPKGIRPDRWIHPDQIGRTKWDRVKNMYRTACLDDNITEEFILMNDDFYIMRPTDIPVAYRCSLEHHIMEMELAFGDRITQYTKLLRGVLRTLTAMNKTTFSYDLHIPMVFNRKKLLYLLNNFPDLHGMRSLYGNYWEIGGKQMDDVKARNAHELIDDNLTFLSSSDESWGGNIGKLVKGRFPERSKYETN